jgi:hypothetical protein
MSEQEADVLNKMLEEIYRFKIEEVKHKNSASTDSLNSYRETETGLFFQASATATTFTATISFQTKYQTVFGIQITPVGTATNYFVQSFDGSSAQVKVVTDATSDNIKFFYRVTGSLE